MRCLILLLSALFVCGCASKPEPAPNSMGYDPIAELARISVETRDEMRLLAKTRDAKLQRQLTDEQKEQKALQSAYIPPGFEQLVDFVDAFVSVDKAVNQIGALAGYEVRFAGRRPAIPIMVRLNAKKKTLNEVLREVGLQTGAAAVVNVYPGPRVIEVEYTNE